MGNINIAFGFDVEAPRDTYPKDVIDAEHADARIDATLEGLHRVDKIFRQEYDVPVTLLFVGGHLATMQRLGYREAVQDLVCGKGYDVQQHTSSHHSFRDIPGASRPVLHGKHITADVLAATRDIESYFGLTSKGVRAPYGYPKGIQDHPDIVDALVNAGMEWVSSDLQGDDWGTPPALYDANGKLRQPYMVKGTDGKSIVELPIAVLQDFHYTNREGASGDAPKTINDIKAMQSKFLDDIATAAEGRKGDISFALCYNLHDITHDTKGYDPAFETHQALLDNIQASGINVVSYQQMFNIAKKDLRD